MERICNRCGCSSFHYNRSRMRMECDSCGTPVYDEQQERQLMEYDRAYSQAMRHLTVGNWEHAINLLKPFLSQYPTEKKLHLAILRAATMDFRDIRMANSNRVLAREAWNKLVRLNGINAQMIRYSRKRYNMHREELKRQRNGMLLWIFAAAFCSIMAGILFGMSADFLAFGCLGGLAVCLCKISDYHPFWLIEKLTATVPDYRSNPFS